MRISVTGHRPQRTGGYSKDAMMHLTDTAHRSLEALEPTLVYTGMALGWDQAVARACLQMTIPYIAMVPFLGQDSVWKAQDKSNYKKFLDHAVEIRVISPGEYDPEKLMIRNRALIDALDQPDDAVLALYDGTDMGGTADCIAYAKKHHKLIYNAWRLHNRESHCLSEIIY